MPKRPYAVTEEDRSFSFCCSGCRQVFLLLRESGLLDGDYKNSELYRTSLRLGIIARPEEETSAHADALPDLSGCRELVFHVDGMWCSSCSWLIEKVLASEPGVAHARVLYASDTAKIFYHPHRIAPEDIAKRIEALGYRVATRDAEPEERWSERNALLIKMGVALFLMNNLMLFSYALYIGYFQELPAEILALFPWLLFLLAIPSVFWCAVPIHRKAWRSLRAAAPTMELLYSLGILSAFSYSTYQLLAGGSHFYFDTAGGLVGLLLVGKFIEVSAKHKASENIHRLYRLLPKKVRLKTPEGERLVAIEKLQVADRFVVKAGEKIPADGIVVAGRAVVDESLLTGEATPVEKAVGARVIASSLNMNGFLEIEATRIGNTTMLSSIVTLVERALSSKSELEQTVDKVARVFVPAVVVLALAVGVLLAFAGAGIEEALLRAITLLAIACPCALGMATPLAVAAGIGRAARRGLLIRDASALHLAGKVTAVVLDKTGTVTHGTFSIRAVSGTPLPTSIVLRLLASLEQASSHPIAHAFMEAACREHLLLSEPTQVHFVQGMGIEGLVEGKRVVVGNQRFVLNAGFRCDDTAREMINREAEAGRTVVFFGIEGNAHAGHVVLGDAIKPTAQQAISALAKLGAHVYLLSGDRESTTRAVATQVGIEQYNAGALPEEKNEVIAQLQADGNVVAMVGDGVNDAPALARADIGIALGNGTEYAMASASVTLLRDDLTLIAEAIELSRRTTRTVKQNLAWAFLYNSIGISLAVAGALNPFMAAIAMLASSISVVFNSMRLSYPKGLLTKRLAEILFPWIERESVRTLEAPRS